MKAPKTLSLWRLLRGSWMQTGCWYWFEVGRTPSYVRERLFIEYHNFATGESGWREEIGRSDRIRPVSQ